MRKRGLCCRPVSVHPSVRLSCSCTEDIVKRLLNYSSGFIVPCATINIHCDLPSGGNDSGIHKQRGKTYINSIRLMKFLPLRDRAIQRVLLITREVIDEFLLIFDGCLTSNEQLDFLALIRDGLAKSANF